MSEVPTTPRRPAARTVAPTAADVPTGRAHGWRVTRGLVGRAGMSGLQRWAIARGVRLESEPLVDPFVEDAAYPAP